MDSVKSVKVIAKVNGSPRIAKIIKIAQGRETVTIYLPLSIRVYSYILVVPLELESVDNDIEVEVYVRRKA